MEMDGVSDGRGADGLLDDPVCPLNALLGKVEAVSDETKLTVAPGDTETTL